MELPALPLKTLLKRASVVILLVIMLVILLRRESRRNFVSYFSTRCVDYHQKDFSRRLSDKLIDYSAAAKRKGIKPCNDDKDVNERIAGGKLVRVKSNGKYDVDRMSFSIPYVTGDSKDLLDEIARRFREKTSLKGLKRARFIVTSMTRKKDHLRSLMKNNSNASVNSPHLYGNAFDITYKRFDAHKLRLTNCDKKFMKEALAEVIWQLRKEKRCWATYETGQNCFHVVCR